MLDKTKSIFISSKHLILVSDGLSEYSEKIKYEDPNLQVHITSFKEFPAFIKKVISVDKENLLLSIKIEFYDSKQKNEIYSIFKKETDNIKPYTLYFSEEAFLAEEKKNIIKDCDFFYQLSDLTYIDLEIKNLYQYLVVVFRLMREKERLNKYIADSFNNIISEQIIKKQKEKIESLYKELEQLSKIDILTKVLNRKAFYEALTQERKRTIRDIWRLECLNRPSDIPIPEQFKNLISDETENKPANTFLDYYGKFVCIMLDIDNFKQVNDTYGHLVGDMVLIKIGEILNSDIALRENDIAGRFGGEEFIILLPETNAQNAKIPANRLRHQINQILFKTKNDTFYITVSMGISEFKLDDESTDDVIHRADKALYYSKEHGKDMVTAYEDIWDV